MSLWLNSGVPATEVARRAEHGIAVLFKIYVHCIDGQPTLPISVLTRRSAKLNLRHVLSKDRDDNEQAL
jgi:hypothetical protein